MKPILGVSFPDDPADALRAYEVLRSAFRCEFEFASLYDVEEHEPDEQDGRRGWDLRHTEDAHRAFQAITAEARGELLRAEASGLVPTATGRHASRPDPNELATYTRLARELLVEDPAGAEEGKWLRASSVVPVFNAALEAEGLSAFFVSGRKTRKLYTALRGCMPGLEIVQDSSGGRTYFRGVNWSDKARTKFHPPPFKGPYA